MRIIIFKLMFLKFGCFLYFCFKVVLFGVSVEGLVVKYRKDKDKFEMEVNVVGLNIISMKKKKVV